ncbi:hypothetical protein [Natrarchaeobius oligotrophus]|nr:hypothetical protein [Natrarchaeobius chitinivorans]
MEPVPTTVELAIYLYFVVVAAVGCALLLRCWFGRRRRGAFGDARHAE